MATDALRKPDGFTKPYRPTPRDFRETYIAMGWDGIVDHYRTNWRCIARWIEECGGDELREARSARTGRKPYPERRASRYVMGRTLTPTGARKRNASHGPAAE